MYWWKVCPSLLTDLLLPSYLVHYRILARSRSKLSIYHDFYILFFCNRFRTFAAVKNNSQMPFLIFWGHSLKVQEDVLGILLNLKHKFQLDHRSSLPCTSVTCSCLFTIHVLIFLTFKPRIKKNLLFTSNFFDPEGNLNLFSVVLY